MIKEAIEKLLQLARPETVVAKNGLEYATSQLQLIKSNPNVASIKLRSLDGIVDYIKSKFDGERELVVHIESATSVLAFDALDQTNDRRVYVQSTALLPNIQYNNYLEREKMNIMLMSNFVPNKDLAEVIQIISNVQEDQAVVKTDDGLSEKVVARNGIATLETITLKPRYTLKPFRTFAEASQPDSEFVLRVREGGYVALFEADGGIWEIYAMQNIKAYLEAKLEEEIKSKTVHIIA